MEELTKLDEWWKWQKDSVKSCTNVVCFTSQSLKLPLLDKKNNSIEKNYWILSPFTPSNLSLFPPLFLFLPSHFLSFFLHNNSVLFNIIFFSFQWTKTEKQSELQCACHQKQMQPFLFYVWHVCDYNILPSLNTPACNMEVSMICFQSMHFYSDGRLHFERIGKVMLENMQGLISLFFLSALFDKETHI